MQKIIKEMLELSPNAVQLSGGFWGAALAMNLRQALPHQWQQLEAGLWLDNLRIAAKEKQGFREGFYFADSDVYKWLDAAARALALAPDSALQAKVDELLSTMEKAMTPDGYLNTFNQLNFPGLRWQNLQIEHELYNLGHMIEAGVAHARLSQPPSASRGLALARRAADLLVKDFIDAPAEMTDGHEEIEIALLRLHQLTGEGSYLELARRFIERRGRIPAFVLLILRQNSAHQRRLRERDHQRALYCQQHPEHQPPRPPVQAPRTDPLVDRLRRNINLLSGKYFQQNAPVRKQTTPVGHSVRFTYLQTAVAMLMRATSDATLLPALEKSWLRLVRRRMYVSGGIGAQANIEGFGRDFELDPEAAYTETCAALGCMLWGWQMTLATRQAQYADLFEWQLYNAASVSMALDGCSYFYDNPLRSRAGLLRRAWYSVPCCPSNVSRVWAGLGGQIYSQEEGSLWVHQYISSQVRFEDGLLLKMETDLPWQGRIRLAFHGQANPAMALHLRVPSWTDSVQVTLNGALLDVELTPPDSISATACGYDPRRAYYLRLEQPWQAGDALEITFGLPLRLYRQDRRIPGCGGMVALGRGPLLYCLESQDQPDVDIFSAVVRPDSLRTDAPAPGSPAAQLGDIVIIQGQDIASRPLTFIPYLYWANRGQLPMTVFFNCG